MPGTLVTVGHVDELIQRFMDTPQPSKAPWSSLPDAAVEAISHVARELRAIRELKRLEFEWRKSHEGLATKQDLIGMESRIMGVITNYATAVNAAFDKISTSVDSIQGDIATLNAKIEELQNSSGAITPEDQALLDGIQSRAEAIATKVDALDAMTPPAQPSIPPTA